ncbi:glycoside hydrolase family 3 protein [Amycolatopsis sp. NBC_01480]|uniref:glycoside hydrolase family 3 protein n=1 Tax=Amycolatopsis sp. NBC_01480 TaxID=2903562 RepID=UPI002E2AD420|nr:glycoside hydrolase family 3 C-terminal domain-containing protein [Amycolatopsis sp. NBC_01480]
MTRDLDALLNELDLETKTRLLAGGSVWSLPPVPEIGLGAVVFSDGPVGVRGGRWSADDPSVTLPSPTALAATWDPALARRVGGLLAGEARRKGVHVLLAPTVNLHRSPLGGRHFECYSEDPLLSGLIGAGYVIGVQAVGVGVAVKHFVANDSETERLTVDVHVAERTLRELYLAPFETIVRQAKPWGVMAAYNSVNGRTMTEHDALVNGVLRREWGFDGVVVSDWLAARDTVGAARGGLDIAMPGPNSVYGDRLAEAVRAGKVSPKRVDAMVRRVLRLAERTHAFTDQKPPNPSEVDGSALAQEVAQRSFVLLRNEPSRKERAALPLDEPKSIALIGALAAEPKILGGGSATVFPDHIVSPLDGLRAALPHGTELRYAVGADPRTTLPPATDNFRLRAMVHDIGGSELATFALREGKIDWIGELPRGLDLTTLDSVDIAGTFTPAVSGVHTFGITGLGHLTLRVGRQTLFDGPSIPSGDIFTALMKVREHRREIELEAGKPVDVRLTYRVPKELRAFAQGSFAWLVFGLGHQEPSPDPDVALKEAVRLAGQSEVAVVVVGTTAEVESEGFDRASLRLPGRQDELVAKVAAANPNTIVVVNAGSPVELPWREDVAAILLTWFPGQEGGAALASVLFGHEEPGGRLPTTWPATLAQSPVTNVQPHQGILEYDEGVFIGYRAAQPDAAYRFGHGLGYTTWSYDDLAVAPTPEGGAAVRVRLRNTGDRVGREVVQVYLSPAQPDAERPVRWLAGFASIEAGPGDGVTALIHVEPRAAETWRAGAWRHNGGEYVFEASHSSVDPRLSTTATLGKTR